MSDNRREALEALRDKVKAGTLHEEKHGGMPMATACYLFFGDNWRDSPWSDRDCIAAYHGSLDAAKSLHDALLPGWDWRAEENVNGYVSHIGPAREEFMPSIMAVSFESAARAWLLSILSALIAETPKGETP